MLDLLPLYVVAISQEMGVKSNWGNSLGVTDILAEKRVDFEDWSLLIRR